jgi:hypothetical protein
MTQRGAGFAGEVYQPFGGVVGVRDSKNPKAQHCGSTFASS